MDLCMGDCWIWLGEWYDWGNESGSNDNSLNEWFYDDLFLGLFDLVVNMLISVDKLKFM